MKRLKKLPYILLIIFILAGCNEKEEATKTASIVLPGDETILATVNGSPITEYELDQAIDKTIGAKNADKIGSDGRKKVLESLAASRAIALAFEKDMTPEQHEEIRKKTLAFREQLLVQKYIATNAKPQPVTQEMVTDYYKKYPERFGAKTEKVYEMISTGRNLRYKERDLLLKSLVKPESKKDWGKWVNELKAKKLPVFYKKGTAVKGLLHKDIETLIAGLGNGKTSKLRFIDERPYLVRITDTKKTPPRPLAEVGTQIRKALGPLQLKKVVRQISKDVMKSATVEYVDGEE